MGRGRYSRSRSRSRGRYRDRSPRGRSRSRSRSPPRRREKKVRKWDDMGDNAAAAGAAGAVPQVGLLQQQQIMALQQSQMMGLLPSQQAGSKKQRELFVGNLTSGMVNEQMLKELFTGIIQTLPEFNPALGPPVLNAQMGAGGQFAFVEFRDEHLASTCLKFHGLECAGRPLKIGRPSGFVEPPMGASRGMDVPVDILQKLGISGIPETLNQMAAISGVPGMIPPTANKKQRELYVGNLALGVVSSAMLKELFTVPLQSMPGNENVPAVLNVDIAGDGKFAFVEFRSEDLATTAMGLFNGMDLCGRPMRVGRPAGYVEPGSAPTLASAQFGLPFGLPGGLSAGLPAPVLPTNPCPASASTSTASLPTPAATLNPATTVICLENLVTEDLLKDDTEYADVVEDIEIECKKSGTVIKIKVPRPSDPEVKQDQIGKAYVKFADATASAAAFKTLNGREFDGNIVKATYLPDDYAL